jgi:putative hemolysin
VDNVIGVLNAKDYFRLDNKTRENIMKEAVREPCFVHESMKADRLFDQMKQRGADHFAIVVDEYGGMSGIITITDLVEELVGDFADDPEDEPAVRLEETEENVWTVPGMTSLSDVCDELEVTLPADKYETFGGYVIAELGEIPKDGSQLSFKSDGLEIEVLEVKHHRIEVCRVKKLPLVEEKEEE